MIIPTSTSCLSGSRQSVGKSRHPTGWEFRLKTHNDIVYDLVASSEEEMSA